VSAYIFHVPQKGSENAINAATRCCAVYGFPIRHSASPAMQNAAFGALALNWRYLAFEVPPAQLAAAIAGAAAMRFAGLNLTVPHKLLAVELVDVLDQSATTWGAVNTIQFQGKAPSGEWLPLRDFDQESPTLIRSVGFNTDADGLAGSLREDLQISLAGSRVLLLGAGGAGRAAALKLAAEKVADLYLVNRTESKALALAAEINKQSPLVNVHIGYPAGKVDLVINSTSLGMKAGDGLPFDAQKFSLPQARAAYDVIYRPAETPFLALARAAGCRTANGLGMLVHQGAKAFEIWTGRAAPFAVMRQAVEQSIYGL
jgi:shikimate dehydrogenase